MSSFSFRPRSAGCLTALIMWVVLAAVVNAETRPTIPNQQSTSNTPVSIIPGSEVLALNDKFKARLDAEIAPIEHSIERARALHELLFGDYGYRVRYLGGYTRTAMETLAYGGGNCVSLANLYVAAARHVDLDAHFQESEIEEWRDLSEENGYYVLAGHVNVMIELPRRRKLTVEFLQAYVNLETKDRVVSDDEALAQYYNNLGMAQLQQGNVQVAHTYLEKALDVYDESALIWSNMGVVKKRLGELAAAERAYLTALRQDEDYPSAAKNLYILYQEIGKSKKAEKYAAIVERHNRRNPYYLSDLADLALDRHDYDEAIDLLKQAIEIKEGEDKFHFALARAYFLDGNLKRATKAMRIAKQMAHTSDDRQRYSNKLAALHNIAQRGI